MANRNEFVEDDADLNQQRCSPGGTQRQQAAPLHVPPLVRPAVLNPNQQQQQQQNQQVQAQTLQQLQQQIQQLQDQQHLTQQ